MAPSRRSTRQKSGSGGSAASSANNNNNNATTARNNVERSVAPHVRERQRAVAEREASRLARPEQRSSASIGHADRKKSAVSSTPFGVFSKQHNNKQSDDATGVNEEWCGPFSVARQMIAKREEAKRLREEEENNNTMKHPLDAAMEELDQEMKRKAHPSMQWKGAVNAISSNGGSLYSKRQKRADLLNQGKAVLSLFDLCVKFLVDNIEYVESLGPVDNSIRTAVTHQLVSHGKLNGQSLNAIAETGIEAIEIVDCSDITQDELSTKLRELIPAGLRYLVLDHSGRCFGEKVVTAIVETAVQESSDLFALSIGGAYMLLDKDAAKLIQSVARTASSLEFKACPLLGQRFCESISTTFASQGTLLELAFEDLQLTETDLQALVAQPKALRNIKSFSLRRIAGLNDVIVGRILEITGHTLEGLDLSENHDLTDAVLASIRVHGAGRLHALTLSGLKQLTAESMEALFTFVEGAAQPPMLRSLDVSNCNHEAVTDDVLQLVTQAATQNRNSEQQQIALLGGLVRLNVQGATLLTDIAMEYLASTSAKTLEELDVSFCPSISDRGLGYLVDKCSRQLGKIYVWGNAQLTDEFFDGNHRINDPSLEIVGVWMKKHTSRTIR